MQNFKSVNQELSLTETLGQVTKIYEEIYLRRVRQTRDAVLQNRVFMESLGEVFTEVKQIYGGVMLRNKNRRRAAGKAAAAVFLSSSKKFSGEVTTKVFAAFADFTEHNRGDLFIVGKSGFELWRRLATGRKAFYFDEADDPLLLPILRQYGTINLFYGKFMSLIKQVEQGQTIREVDYSSFAKKRARVNKDFIVEPSVPAVADFFERELFDAFFRQAVAESTLAALGSSISQLETATNNTDQRLATLYRVKRRLNRQAANRRQNNMLPSVVFAGGFGR